MKLWWVLIENVSLCEILLYWNAILCIKILLMFSSFIQRKYKYQKNIFLSFLFWHNIEQGYCDVNCRHFPINIPFIHCRSDRLFPWGGWQFILAPAQQNYEACCTKKRGKWKEHEIVYLSYRNHLNVNHLGLS